MSLKDLMKTNSGWGIAVLRVVTGIIFVGHVLPKFGWAGDGGLADSSH